MNNIHVLKKNYSVKISHSMTVIIFVTLMVSMILITLLTLINFKTEKFDAFPNFS